MPECLPFCAWRYNPLKVRIEEVVAPPYDVVSEDEVEYYKNKSSYNIFHLELSINSKKAKNLLDDWIKNQILIKEKNPSVYFYELDFFHLNQNFSRKGFILLVKLSYFDEGNIFPHEKTYKEVAEKRLELLKETKFQFSQIFALYEDSSLESIENINKEKNLLYEIKYEKEIHRLYRISEKKFIKDLLSYFKNKKLYIADGHHRYLTALKFKEYMEDFYGKDEFKDYNYVSMYLSPLEDKNLLMLPTYRAYYLENPNEVIKKFYEIAEIIEAFEIKNLNEINQNFHHYLQKNFFRNWIFLKGNQALFFLLKKYIFEKIKEEEPILSEIPLYNFLKVSEEIIKLKEEKLRKENKVKFVSDVKELLKEVKKGALGIIFPYTSPQILKKVTEAKKLMPHKCTYFYPKILTGLILNEIKGEYIKFYL